MKGLGASDSDERILAELYLVDFEVNEVLQLPRFLVGVNIPMAKTNRREPERIDCNLRYGSLELEIRGSSNEQSLGGQRQKDNDVIPREACTQFPASLLALNRDHRAIRSWKVFSCRSGYHVPVLSNNRFRQHVRVSRKSCHVVERTLLKFGLKCLYSFPQVIKRVKLAFFESRVLNLSQELFGLGLRPQLRHH